MDVFVAPRMMAGATAEICQSLDLKNNDPRAGARFVQSELMQFTQLPNDSS